ncbi:hypothetical protein [Nannocystis punicea]|uniref:Uncharacterized protein n=1 Tax=Nannocystis punicea TaxID=2995304 RepID=A0ABY7HH49_9BACT|nr:hypothetical protein [Nannocystis poenicansa]WAS98638.1 hypothetical protein O0S08_21080 [Nannocystis poenicansa]
MVRRSAGALLSLVAGAALGVACGPDRPPCDEAALATAVAQLESTAPPQRPVEAARAILRACPAPTSLTVTSHLGFLRDLQQDPPRIYPLPAEDAEFERLWREVCPSGRELAALGLSRELKAKLYEDCDLDRLAVLTAHEGRMVSGHTLITWTLYPWLRESGVSADTTRGLMRALLSWPGWSLVKDMPAGLELPRVAGSHAVSITSGTFDWYLHDGEIRADGQLVADVREPGWWNKVVDMLAQPDSVDVALFADASTSGTVLLHIARAVALGNDSLRLVVATGDLFQPFAALPVTWADTSDPALRVRPDATVAEVTREVSALMGLPCCGEVSPLACPRQCSPERVRLITVEGAKYPTPGDPP